MAETPANDLAVQVRGLTRAFGVRKALNDVSFDLPGGAFLSIFGPNGAGKTTLVKVLTTLLNPSKGSASVCGFDVVSEAVELRHRIGLISHNPLLYPDLTAEENLLFFAEMYGLEDPAARVRELLVDVELDHRRLDVTSTFSRGMLQRLGIAQALLGEPSVVILDEPASGLDPVGQRDVRNLMLELRSAGVTVLLSSHQLSEVEAVCDKVTILNRGLVAAEGDINELLNIEGRTSVRATALAELPASVASAAEEVAVSGGVWVFSVPTPSARVVVDAIDDAGGTIIAVTPKRESLEDYFASLLDAGSKEVAS